MATPMNSTTPAPSTLAPAGLSDRELIIVASAAGGGGAVLLIAIVSYVLLGRGKKVYPQVPIQPFQDPSSVTVSVVRNVDHGIDAGS